jgi:hypothetical protein
MFITGCFPSKYKGETTAGRYPGASQGLSLEDSWCAGGSNRAPGCFINVLFWRSSGRAGPAGSSPRVGLTCSPASVNGRDLRYKTAGVDVKRPPSCRRSSSHWGEPTSWASGSSTFSRYMRRFLRSVPDETTKGLDFLWFVLGNRGLPDSAMGRFLGHRPSSYFLAT